MWPQMPFISTTKAGPDAGPVHVYGLAQLQGLIITGTTVWAAFQLGNATTQSTVCTADPLQDILRRLQSGCADAIFLWIGVLVLIELMYPNSTTCILINWSLQ